MLEKSVLELINRDLDGAATAEEKARLRRICQENEEARKYAEDLRALSRGLAAVGRGVPPPTLRPAVMRSITGADVAARPRAHVSLLENLLRMPGNLKPAMVFAGGVAAGLLLFALGLRVMAPASFDEKDLVGSLAVHGSDFLAGKPVDFKNGDLRATVQTGVGTGHTIVRIRVDIPPGTLMVFAYAGNGSQIETIDVARANLAEISLEEGRVVVKGLSSGELGILFSGNAEVLAGARLLFSDGYGGEWNIPLGGTLNQ